MPKEPAGKARYHFRAGNGFPDIAEKRLLPPRKDIAPSMFAKRKIRYYMANLQECAVKNIWWRL